MTDRPQTGTPVHPATVRTTTLAMTRPSDDKPPTTPSSASCAPTTAPEPANVDVLRGGFWLAAYGYRVGDDEFVLHINDELDGFRSDQLAVQYGSAALPVHDVFTIGEGFGCWLPSHVDTPWSIPRGSRARRSRRAGIDGATLQWLGGSECRWGGERGRGRCRSLGDTNEHFRRERPAPLGRFVAVGCRRCSSAVWSHGAAAS